MTTNSQLVAEKAHREKFEGLYRELEKKNASEGKDMHKLQTDVDEAKEAAVSASFFKLEGKKVSCDLLLVRSFLVLEKNCRGERCAAASNRWLE